VACLPSGTSRQEYEKEEEEERIKKYEERKNEVQKETRNGERKKE
jgi:hypothetical protein